MNITLGVIARDPVTGLEGTVVSKLETVSGLVQFAIRPLGKDGKLEEAVYVDPFLLEYVGPGVSDKAKPAASDVKVQVGNEVEDLITGIVGIAQDKYTHLNGCVLFTVMPKIGKDKSEAPRGLYVDHKRLKVRGRGLAQSAVDWDALPKTGGPERKMPDWRHP